MYHSGVAGIRLLPEPLDPTWRNLPPAPPYDDLRLRVLVARFFRLDQRWKAEHRHDPFDRLYFITEGSGELITREGRVVLVPGMSVLIPAFTAHRHRCAASLTLYWTHVITVLKGDHGLFDAVPGIHCRQPERLATVACFERLCTACRETEPAAVLVRQVCARELLSPFFDLLGSDLDQERLRFHQALEAIEDGRGDGAGGVARLAGLAGMSPDHFTKRFTGLFGMTPARYRQRRRLAAAQRLLAESDITIDAVARRCGFCDGFHLSKVFRRLLHTTPSAYRRRSGQPTP